MAATTQAGVKRFYIVLAALALVGLGVMAYLLLKPSTVSIPANVTVQPSDTSGFRGYVKGSSDASVEITEFADYQCPFCQTFATLQMPAIEDRLIKTGRVRWRYRDFPLQQHPFARLAAHSAACADEQGKYWDQHQRIYEGQSEWSGARDAGPIFRNYAKAAGLALDRSTPTLLVSGRLYRGRFDSDAIIKLVDSLAPRRQ
jgi:protein-disulfide isomerase